MFHVTAIYPNAAGSRFDGDYYLGPHRALALRTLQPHGLRSISVALGRSALNGGPPPFWAISQMVFADRAGFEAGMAAASAAIAKDTPKYTDVTPILQISHPPSDQ